MQIELASLRLPIAAFLAFAVGASAASAVSLAEGLSAYRDNRVAEGERMLAALATDPGASAGDRASALRELGRIDGLVRGETDAIAAAMAQTPEGEERCATAAVALRIYRDLYKPAVPLAYADDAARGVCTPAAAEALQVERVRNHLAIAAGDAALRPSHLAAASADLEGVSPAARGVTMVAGARFALAMAQRDPTAAFTAWRDYYWLTDADAPQALAVFSGRVASIFSAGLAPNPSEDAVLALIELLVRAGFTADAQHYAAETGIAARAADDPRWRRAAAYFAFNAAIRAATLRANREMASGGRARWYEAEVRSAMGQLMRAAQLSGDPRVALAQNFGVYGTLGETSGYPSLHGGHLVQDERLAVSQYGRTGEVRFIVIDNMLANGYESWLWDGWAETGGWSSDGNTIVQVRSAYTDGPLSALRRTRPGAARDAFRAAIERADIEERAALGRDGVAPLPATENRLLLQAWEQIAARVGDDDSAFVAESWRATNQTSIEAHEGRHALDNLAQPGLSGNLLEYRAKLSQIVFADYPRLGLASIASGEQGDTPHGYGNRRVLEGYRRWMRQHAGEIAGFDPDTPALAQLHLLTDDQIRAAARSLDPWAR